jgi:hypothetical protein
MKLWKMPIGIQDFEKLRTDNYVYVDKTAFIHQLAETSNAYFLGRPRRFGKSLLLSTIKAYFQGKKELFEAGPGRPGLAIAELEQDWIAYPVFHFDLAGDADAFMSRLRAFLASIPCREALEQIDRKGHPHTASGCKLVKIGVVFDQETRTLGEWETASRLEGGG